MRSFYTNFAAMIEKHFRIDARYFLSGGFWLSLGQVVSITFGLITTALLAHFLSENNYGTYRYLIGIAVILSSFSLTGLGQSVLQTAAKKYYGFYRATLRTNFIYNLTIPVIAITGAVYYWFNENIVLATGCILIAFFQPLINTFQFIPSFLQGSRRFKESTILHTVRMFLISIISITTLLLTQNILMLFAAYLISYLITNIISYIIFSPPTAYIPKEITTKYLKYAKHTSVRNIIGNISQRLDTVIIFTQLGATELAIYSIAIIIPEQIKGSFKNLAALLLPKYAKFKHLADIKKSIPKRSLQLLVILIVITTLYVLLSPFVYELIFPKYENAIFLSQLFALSFPAMIAVIPLGALQSQLKDKELHHINIWSSVITVLLTLSLITFFGLIGAILSKITARYFNLFLTFFYLYRKNE